METKAKRSLYFTVPVHPTSRRAKMDISILIQRDKEDEVNMRNLLALSEKKYNLQKELESLKAGLPAKQSELGKLQKEVVSLKTEVSVLEKQKEIAKSTAWNLMRQLVVEKAEVKKIQVG